MKRGVLVNAEVGDCTQEYADNEGGPSGPYQHCDFSYEVDGSIYSGSSDFAQDVGSTVEILYLPENPSVHREKMGAARGIFDFVFRKIILGTILLVMLVGSGFSIIKIGVKEFLGKSG